MVHTSKIKRFVRDSYRIAELMLQFSRNQEVQPEK